MIDEFNTRLAQRLRNICEFNPAALRYGLTDNEIIQEILDGKFDYGCPHIVDRDTPNPFPESIFNYSDIGKLFDGVCYMKKNIKKEDKDIKASLCDSKSECAECWQLQYRLVRKAIDKETTYWDVE